MTREDIFERIREIQDPQKDYKKILANLHYTHHVLMEKYRRMFSAYDLSSVQSNVLSIVDFYTTGASLEDIKKLVLEPNSDVSRTVNRLVEKGFVEKLKNPDNRRKVVIRITPKGSRVLKSISDDKRLREFTSTLDLAETQTFISVLSKLRDL